MLRLFSIPLNFHFRHARTCSGHPRLARAFDAFEFDPAKSGAVFELRGFDLAYARRMFPGYVLEREDTRVDYGVIGEVVQDILVVIYTPRRGTCRLIAAWEAEGWELDLWYERYS